MRPDIPKATGRIPPRIKVSISSFPRTAVQPSTTGIAPGNAPTNVHNGDTFFSGVYTARYVAEVRNTNKPVSKLVYRERYTEPPRVKARPTVAARKQVMRPDGSGRSAVRRIRASTPDSRTSLSAAVPLETRA